MSGAHKPHAANPAVALGFQSEHQWREVAGAGRWLKFARPMKLATSGRVVSAAALALALFLTVSCSPSGRTEYYYPADLKGKSLPVWQVTDSIPLAPDQAVLAAMDYLKPKDPSVSTRDVDSIELRKEYGIWIYSVTLTDRRPGHYNIEVVQVLMDGSVWKPSRERPNP